MSTFFIAFFLLPRNQTVCVPMCGARDVVSRAPYAIHHGGGIASCNSPNSGPVYFYQQARFNRPAQFVARRIHMDIVL